MTKRRNDRTDRQSTPARQKPEARIQKEPPSWNSLQALSGAIGGAIGCSIPARTEKAVAGQYASLTPTLDCRDIGGRIVLEWIALDCRYYRRDTGGTVLVTPRKER
jgi:hypothetical protein